MAKIHEELVIIKISKLLKDGEKQDVILTPELREAVAQLAEQLLFETVGTSLIIEAINGDEA